MPTGSCTSHNTGNGAEKTSQSINGFKCGTIMIDATHMCSQGSLTISLTHSYSTGITSFFKGAAILLLHLLGGAEGKLLFQTLNLSPK